MVETLELVTDELEDKKDDTKVTLVSAAISSRPIKIYSLQ